MDKIYWFFLIIFFSACQSPTPSSNPDEHTINKIPETPFIVVLGTIQDAGSPHIACKKDCCKGLFNNPDKERQVVSLGLVDNIDEKSYLFEATPDISRQLKTLKRHTKRRDKEFPDGIFLTHAHIGHYAGLMYLGKEATDAKEVPVYAMPRMQYFLSNNGPWDQLVNRNNIVLKEFSNPSKTITSKNTYVSLFTVPHRDEYSETVGYKIHGPSKSALFIPDIDKWDKWDFNIIEEIKKVDYAFLDATFYDAEEINNRDISEIPHPFVVESMEKFKNLPSAEKAKIYFIHLNHTNPLLNFNSKQSKKVLDAGFNIARINEIHTL